MAVGTGRHDQAGERVVHRGAPRTHAPALLAFAVGAGAAVVAHLRAARWSWFGWDDWDFLAARTAGDVDDLLRPHNDHWSTLPVLTYRALFHLFGLDFTPYLILAVVLHVTTAVLLLIVMLRSGIDPWIASAVAVLYGALEAGVEGTASLFNLAFSGLSVVLGLAHLLLADHDGRPGWRDVAGVAAGIGAVASSAVGVPMLVAVGLSVALRRGWRAAATNVVPVAAVFALWYLTHAVPADATGPLDTVHFAQRSAWALLVGAGSSALGALALGAGALAGWYVQVARRPGGSAPRPHLTVGLAAGGIVFLGLTGFGRGDFPSSGIFGDVAAAPHYVQIAAVFLLPAIGVGLDGLVVAWRPLRIVVPLVLVLMVTANLVGLERAATDHDQRAVEDLVLSLPRAPRAAHAPRDLVPEPILTGPVTVGWLVAAAEAGKLPAPPRSAITLDEQIEVRLRLSQTPGMRDLEPCTAVGGTIERTLAEGAHVSIGGDDRASIAVRLGDEWSTPVVYGEPFTDRSTPRIGTTLTVLEGPTDLRISPAGDRPPWLCG